MTRSIPPIIQITDYSSMKATINWALMETEERRRQIADAIVPPHYDLDALPREYNAIWRKFNALSGAEISFDFESKLLDIYYRLLQKGKELERAQNVNRALDYYLLAVFNCCPTGTLYYERPRTILEKQKRYILALMMCDLGDRAYYMAHSECVPEFSHVRERLLQKMRRSGCEWPDGEYPLYIPDMPQPWVRPSRPSLEEIAEWGEDVCDGYARHDEGLGRGVWPIDKLPMPHPNCLRYQTEVVPTLEDAADMLAASLKKAAWGEAQEGPLEDAFRLWQQENAEELNNWYSNE